MKKAFSYSSLDLLGVEIFKVSEIAEDAGITRHAAYERVKIALDQGLVERIGGGRYKVTDKGARARALFVDLVKACEVEL